MSFQDLEIKSEYRSLLHDVTGEFYIPLLNEAIEYKRAVGFFSSSVLSQIAIGIASLAKNGGKIQLVASPYLSEEDIKAIRKGYEWRKIVGNAVLREMKAPENPFDERRLNLLANLIANNVLDIKIAFTKSKSMMGMYHEKMGIFVDREDNYVAFSGSMNESNNALKSNYEVIDVWCSWKGDEQRDRVKSKQSAFTSIWNNTEPNVSIVDFSELKQEIIDRYKKIDISDYDQEAQELEEERTCSDKLSQRKGAMIPSNVVLHNYQNEAINRWEEKGFCGIFAMATGTGKTYAGLGAIARLCDKTNDHIAIFIVCPFQHLVEQWVEDIKRFNLDPIIGYSNSPHKNFKKLLEHAVYSYNLGVKKIFCFVCTNATFASNIIQIQVQKLKGDVLLLVDEAHNFGAMKISKTLTAVFNYRLALSATFERHNDDVGTGLLYKYFGDKCIEYGLNRAIEEKMLTPYYYYPVVIYLSDIELEKYTELSIELAKCVIIDKKGQTKLSERGKSIAIKRSRIIAGAANKISMLSSLIYQYKEETQILIYCGATKLIDSFKDDFEDDEEETRQIDAITRMLGNDMNMRIARFTSRENIEQRALRIKMFKEGEVQALVAIKCLDEGINIPSIKIAFILASTTNPKEYIQRRGRVLRLCEGKKHAIIYDFVTLPRPLHEVITMSKNETKRDKSLVNNELKRMIEFKDLSLNPFDSDKIIERIIDTYELYENTGSDYLK